MFARRHARAADPPAPLMFARLNARAAEPPARG